MDLYAYANIDRLEEIMKKNDIVVPRLRGLRLMSEEEVVPDKNIKDDFHHMEVDECEQLLRATPLYKVNSNIHTYSWETDRKIAKYIKNGRVMWDKIHGRFRKNLKFAIKMKKKAIEKQYKTFNKYVGRKDILMIHARVGGDNWTYYDCHKDVATKSWFIEKVDDFFDRTYCDIYVKIPKED